MSTLLVPPICAFAKSVIFMPDFRFFKITLPLISGSAYSPDATIPFQADALIVLRQISGAEQVVLSFPITLIPSSNDLSIVLSINFDLLLKTSIAQVFSSKSLL
jgi:hypothetical protein